MVFCDFFVLFALCSHCRDNHVTLLYSGDNNGNVTKAIVLPGPLLSPRLLNNPYIKYCRPRVCLVDCFRESLFKTTEPWDNVRKSIYISLAIFAGGLFINVIIIIIIIVVVVVVVIAVVSVVVGIVVITIIIIVTIITIIIVVVAAVVVVAIVSLLLLLLFLLFQLSSLLCSSSSPPSSSIICLLVGFLTSQQPASVSQGRICSDNFTCCHTEIEIADQNFHLTQSQYTDTGPTSPRADPITPGAWQGSHWNANFEVTGMTRPRKNPGASGIRTRDLPLSRRTP